MADTTSATTLMGEIEALFRDVDGLVRRVGSLPEVVRENRRQRAVQRVYQAVQSRGTEEMPPELRQDLRRLLKKWAQVGFDDGLREVQALEIRCAEEHDLVSARQSGDRERVLAALERKYRGDVATEFGRHELRGIQTSERVLLDLERVYVPLYLKGSLSDLKEENDRLPVLPGARRPVPEVLREHSRLLIVGAPGSGKTTLVAWLASGLAARDVAKELGWREQTLPFVIEARRLESGSLCAESIAALTGCDADVMRRALKEGRAALFVDGLDEAPAAVAEELVRSLEASCSYWPELPVVITSRPGGFLREGGECLGRTERAELDAMTTEEVHEFIHKWCLAAEESLTRDESVARDKAEAAAKDLIERVENTRPVKRLAQNPLLCSILCVVHRFLGHRIPEHRVTLYERCTDALLYEWDAAKMPEGALVGKLDADQKRVLLSDLALRMHENKQSEIREEEVIQAFGARLAGFDVPSDARSIVEEIRDRSGVLVERRPGFFAFSHLTFQEYLAAYELARRGSAIDVADRYEDEWWHEVIVLTAGMKNVDAGPLLSALLEKNDDRATFLAAQCLETAIEVPLKIRKEVEERMEALVPPRSLTDASRLGKLGLVAAPILTKALRRSHEPNEKFLSMLPLGGIDYEPAVSAVLGMAGDHRNIPILEELLGGDSALVGVDFWALIFLASLAESSDLAIRAFRQAANSASDRAIHGFRQIGMGKLSQTTRRRLLELLPDRPRAASPDRSSSKGS